MAACTPAPPTSNTYGSGDDTVTCATGSTPDPDKLFDLGGGNDTLTVNNNPIFSNLGSLATNGTYSVVVVTGNTGNDTFNVNGGDFHGQIQGNDGNDHFNITAGTFRGNIAGDQTGQAGADIFKISGGEFFGSVNAGGGNDVMYVTGGTFHNEFQNGAGTDYSFLFGGTFESTVEMQRGSVNSVIDVDGGRLLAGFEMQNGNATFAQAVNPTFYLRSGFVSVGTWGNANDSTFIIDPVNSQKPSSVDPYASDIAAAFANGTANPDTHHLLTLGVGGGDDDDDGPAAATPTIALGNGNDKLSFVGAVNTGTGIHNLHFGDEDELDEEELPILDGDGQSATADAFGRPGTPGTNDSLTVAQGSNLLLGQVINFENLSVTGGSQLQLNAEEYHFGTAAGDPTKSFVHVDGTSILWLTSDEEVELETAHFVLDSGAGFTPRLEGLPDYYNTFATGGILKIGAAPAAAGGDDDDDDDVVALDEPDEPSGPAKADVTISTGASTFVNGGTIDMLNGVVGDKLTVEGADPNVGGAYLSVGGKLAVEAVLDAGGPGALSQSDKLEIEGATVTGTTTVYVKNVGGTGAFTGHGDDDGIKIAEIEDGSGTAANNSFILAANNISGKAEVIGGAFSYRLVPFVTNGGDDADYRLQSDILDQDPAYSSATGVAQKLAYSSLDTLYKRLGEIRSGAATDGTAMYGSVGGWVRGMYSEVDTNVKSGFDFGQQNSGVLAGLDHKTKDEYGTWLVGIFGGQQRADADVNATIWGGASRSSVEIDSWTLGGYVSYAQSRAPGVGLYSDTVLKFDDFTDIKMAAVSRSASGSTEGSAATISSEVGYGIPVGGGNATLQPQAQLSYTTLTLTDFDDSYGLRVENDNTQSLVGRAGLQLQGNYGGPGSQFSPYVIVNVLSEFLGDNNTTIAGTKFASDTSGVWYSVGGGVTAELGRSLSLYGSGEYSFGDVQGWGGTGGVKMRW